MSRQRCAAGGSALAASVTRRSRAPRQGRAAAAAFRAVGSRLRLTFGNVLGDMVTSGLKSSAISLEDGSAI